MDDTQIDGSCSDGTSRGGDMPVGSAETEGRHRGSAAVLSPIEELGWDGGREAGQIDVVIQPRQILKPLVPSAVFNTDGKYRKLLES